MNSIRILWSRGLRYVQHPDGRLFPVIAGGDETATVPVPTIQDLEDERGRVMAELDDILTVARSENRSLTDEERDRHDTAASRFDELTVLIRSAAADETDTQRHARHETRRSLAITAPPLNRVTTGTEPPVARRSLDELLWATDETVAAGSFDRTGVFRANAYGATNPVEQVIVRSETSDAAPAPRIDEFLPEQRTVIRAFQRLTADMALFGLLVDKQARSSAHGFEVARGHRLFHDRWQRVLRAMDVDTTAEGVEWVPTGLGASVHEKVRAAGKIAPLFSRIDLPTNPWKWPFEGADATAYRVAEPTGDTATKVTASTPGTGAATFDAEIFGARSLFSRSLDADSAIAVLPYVQRKLVQAFLDGEEKAILDGDTDGTHQDSDVGASVTDTRTAWDGLRKRALANAATAGTNVALTTANLLTTLATMSRWGLNPAELAALVSISSYFKLLGDTNVVTVDKMGPRATILNGQLASVYGIPLIVSEHVRENLNASGVHDGVTTNRTYAAIVNRNEWVMGQRMGLDVEADDSIYRETYQRVLVGFMREDFQNIGDASTNDDTAIFYNVAP